LSLKFPLSDKIKKTTCLSAILWKEAQTDKSLLNNGYFEHGDMANRKPIDISKTVDDVSVDMTGKRNLYLLTDKASASLCLMQHIFMPFFTRREQRHLLWRMINTAPGSWR
jgi:hypothetical protein